MVSVIISNRNYFNRICKGNERRHQNFNIMLFDCFCYQPPCKNSFWNQHFVQRMRSRKKNNAPEQYYRVVNGKFDFERKSPSLYNFF